ncbi:oxidoreductase [Trypanosoma rangeli]|uniref:Oxidoreductase n=1 Tax=Trypanosoma rangeli TaxID=5698 RepID=A0A3R7NH72_TRYRA|nr:oxidoreductase [Trypanosoma rangeli]RNF02611.1 oxidoreductase [Trypanosoma rangeli]|eukprot:RNF02611.1 oxidoreductase [Trypanosoma rangeli]
MHQLTCVLLVCVTCMYWAMAMLILLLRVVDPHMRSVARYGARYGMGSAAADDINNNGSAAAGTRTAVYTSCKARENPTDYRGWLWNSVAFAVNALESSILCRVRVSRKCGFCVFYLTGMVSSLLLWQLCIIPFHTTTNTLDTRFSTFMPGGLLRDAAVCYGLLPLVAFFMHCAVRLWECLYVHRFRGGPQDTVTLFAALAGCSFYVFAVISSSPVVCRVAHAVASNPAVPRPLGGVDESHFSPVVPVTTVVAFFLHLFLQGLQGLHHGILARMRDAPAPSSNSFEAPVLDGKQHAYEVRHSVEASTETSSFFYRFPNTSLFAYVLEPHYTCEILMYAVNAVSLWTLIFNDTAPILTVWQSRGVYCALLLATSYAASLGVVLFSLFNLAITSSEHRRFWSQLNEKREPKERVPPWNLFYRVW